MVTDSASASSAWFRACIDGFMKGSRMEHGSTSNERRIADLTILYEVSCALQNTLEEDKILYMILVGLTHGRGLGFNRAFILLTDPVEHTLKGRLAIGPSSPEEASSIWMELRDKYRSLGELLQQVPHTAIKRDLRVNQIVSRLRVPLSDTEHCLLQILRSRMPDEASGGVFKARGLAVDPRTVEILGSADFAATPLFHGEHDFGLLLADNFITHAPIEPDSLRLLQIYAQAASTAIHNASLYRLLRERVVQCETSNRTLRESQQRLLHAERLSIIGKMAALLAHEIRTPLVAIGGFARKLLRATDEADPRRDDLKIIVEEVRRLELLIGEVLGFSKVSKLDMESTDIGDLVRSVIASMAETLEKASVKAVVHIDPRLPTAMADKFQLKQALINLIVNAVDAMPSGGTLTVTALSEGEYLEIGIVDTGVGIAQEHWSKLFAPFFTTKASGTGLGLAIVSQVIESHKGSLRFESIPGQGTSFHIRLARNPAIEEIEEAAPADVTTKGLLP